MDTSPQDADSVFYILSENSQAQKNVRRCIKKKMKRPKRVSETHSPSSAKSPTSLGLPDSSLPLVTGNRGSVPKARPSLQPRQLATGSWSGPSFLWPCGCGTRPLLSVAVSRRSSFFFLRCFSALRTALRPLTFCFSAHRCYFVTFGIHTDSSSSAWAFQLLEPTSSSQRVRLSGSPPSTPLFTDLVVTQIMHD